MIAHTFSLNSSRCVDVTSFGPHALAPQIEGGCKRGRDVGLVISKGEK